MCSSIHVQLKERVTLIIRIGDNSRVGYDLL